MNSVSDNVSKLSPETALPRVLIAGYGDLGSRLGHLLVEDGCQVYGLNRSGQSRQEGVSMIAADVTSPQTLGVLGSLDPDIMIYCVSADAQSDDSYHAHYLDGLRNVLEMLRHGKPLRHVFFVSSTRVYGQHSEAVLDENTPAIASDFGSRRLLEAESLLEDLPCKSTVLRLSGIYGPGRLHMRNLAGDPSKWPEQNIWSNRIHRDDAAAFIAFLIERAWQGGEISDCYVVTDCCPTPQYEVLLWLSGKAGIDVRELRIPPPRGGKRLSNARMISTGFELRHPDFRSGYSTL